MARKGFVLKLEGDWDKMDKWLLAFGGNLDKALTLGTKRAVQYGLQRVTEEIQRKVYTPNSALTVYMKAADGYGDTPLIRKGGLLRAISTDVLRSTIGAVGLLQQRGKTDYTNIGVLLHDGGTIKITPKMRGAFARKLAAIEKKVGHAAPVRSSGKGYIRIPPRRFIQDVFDSADFVREVMNIYDRAIRDTLGF